MHDGPVAQSGSLMVSKVGQIAHQPSKLWVEGSKELFRENLGNVRIPNMEF